MDLIERNILQRLRYDAGDRNHLDVYMTMLNMYLTEQYCDKLAHECIPSQTDPRPLFKIVVMVVREKIMRLFPVGGMPIPVAPLTSLLIPLRNGNSEMHCCASTPPHAEPTKPPCTNKSIAKKQSTPNKPEEIEHPVVDKMERLRKKRLYHLKYVGENCGVFSKGDTSFLLAEDECYPCHVPTRKSWLYD